MCIIKYTHPTHEFQNLEQKTETSEVISRCQPGFRTLLQADRTSARSTQRSPGSTRFKIKHHRSLLGMVSRKKVAVLLDFVQITSPPSPQFGQLVPLSLNAKNVDLSDIQNDSLSKSPLKSRQNTCFVGHVYNPKKQFKLSSSNYWHFGGNRLLLLTKNALMKR